MQAFFSALLVSGDASVVSAASRILGEQGFAIQSAATAPAAHELTRRNRFDLALYDQDTPGALELAAQSYPCLPTIVIAMLRTPKISEVAGKRVHFILQKPFTLDLLARCSRAANGFIMSEKRATFRHNVRIVPTSVNVVHSGAAQPLKDVVIANLSHHGMCMETRQTVPQGAILQVNFSLPGNTPGAVTLKAVAVWVHGTGRVGLKFVDLPGDQQNTLSNWLNSMLPWNRETNSKVPLAS